MHLKFGHFQLARTPHSGYFQENQQPSVEIAGIQSFLEFKSPSGTSKRKGVISLIQQKSSKIIFFQKKKLLASNQLQSRQFFVVINSIIIIYLIFNNILVSSFLIIHILEKKNKNGSLLRLLENQIIHHVQNNPKLTTSFP